ncbi:MAG TPA: efflux RND transporter periplasmic adaptor subunit [Candidatus Acidoferrum sp.]|nr:efflux RND transporter periplasmic adaptor subunit [Candidatus Acidoferrum sp.]
MMGTIEKCMLAALSVTCLLCGCGREPADVKAEAPPPAVVEQIGNANKVEVDHPEQFPLFTAIEHTAKAELNATGVVAPDVSRTVPVISLAVGRVVELDARLGDTVKKGQLLLRVQSADLASAFSDYRKAVADEVLARTQFERAEDLYKKGAISLNDLQVAKDAAAKANVDVETTIARLRVLGGDPANPTEILDIRAPISGVITDQQVTTASGVQGLSSTNPFTISDISRVWILCDVYENDLSIIHLGETADIRLNAYPDRKFTGRISNVGTILDPNLRTAKVRVEVENPGLMKLGMFVTATFHGKQAEMHAAVPADAILHLHDRDWVYVPAGGKQFQRLEVTTGETLPGNLQEIVSGLKPGQQVVRNALVLQTTAEQ